MIPSHIQCHFVHRHFARLFLFHRGTLFRHLGNYNEAQNDFHKAIHKCGHNEDHPMFRLAMKQLAFTYNDVAVAHYK